MQQSLGDSLFSRTQQRVLGVLFAQPERGFNASEIIRRAAVGRGSVQRELARLASSGLVTVTAVGNQKLYQANARSPLFRELRSIVLKTSGVAEAIRAALAPLADDIELALIFGSVAKRQDRAESDIDLLIVADDIPLETIFARLAPVERRLARKIAPKVLTPAEYRRRRTSRNPFLEKVLAGEHLTLMGTTDGDAATRSSRVRRTAQDGAAGAGGDRRPH